MNLIKKVLLSGAGVALSTTAIVAPLVVLHQNSNNNQNQIENNVNNNVALLKNENSVENHLNAVNLNEIDNMIDNQMDSNKLQSISMFVNNNSSTSVIKQKALLLQKAKLIAKQIMDKKINFNDLLKFLKEKEKTIPKAFLDSFKNKTNLEIIKIKAKQKQQMEYKESIMNLFEVNSNNPEIQEQNLQQLAPAQHETLVIAGVDTAASIATAAVATAMWCIPFFGWPDATTATADSILDAATSALTWANYYGIKNEATYISSIIAEGATGGFLLNDAWSFIANNFSKIVNKQDITLAVNLATSWADPEVSPWYAIALETANTIFDAIIFTMGIFSLTNN